MTSVYHVTTVHLIPDPRIFLKECVTLSEAGYDVTVLACSEEPRISYRGYQIVSVGKESRNRWHRLLYQVRVFRMLRQAKPDIIHFHDPELLPMMIIIAHIWRSKSKVIFDVHENYSSTLGRKLRGFSLTGFIYDRLFRIAERNLYFILAEDSYNEFCEEVHPVIRNYPAPFNEPVPWSQRRKRVVYIGSIGLQRGALEMIHGFASARLTDWELVVIGRCNDQGLLKKMETEAKNLSIAEQVQILGYLPAEKSEEFVRDSRIGLALLHPIPNYLHSLPTKVFEYLSLEVPVIVSDFPFYQHFYAEVPGVYFVDPLSPEKIGQAIRRLSEDVDFAGDIQRGGNYVRNNFNWLSQGRQLLEIYNQILADR